MRGERAGAEGEALRVGRAVPEVIVTRVVPATELGSQAKRVKVELEMKGGTGRLQELPVGCGSFPAAGRRFLAPQPDYGAAGGFSRKQGVGELAMGVCIA